MANTRMICSGSQARSRSSQRRLSRLPELSPAWPLPLRSVLLPFPLPLPLPAASNIRMTAAAASGVDPREARMSQDGLAVESAVEVAVKRSKVAVAIEAAVVGTDVAESVEVAIEGSDVA